MSIKPQETTSKSPLPKELVARTITNYEIATGMDQLRIDDEEEYKILYIHNPGNGLADLLVQELSSERVIHYRLYIGEKGLYGHKAY